MKNRMTFCIKCSHIWPSDEPSKCVCKSKIDGKFDGKTFAKPTTFEPWEPSCMVTSKPFLCCITTLKNHHNGTIKLQSNEYIDLLFALKTNQIIDKIMCGEPL